MKRAFIVQTLGYWGRGETLKKAAEDCQHSGASKVDMVSALVCLGDDKPEISHGGLTISHLDSATIIELGHGFRLGALLRLKA